MGQHLSADEEEAYGAGFMAGSEATRAGIAADLRDILGRLYGELRVIRAALGLPAPEPFDEPLDHVNGGSRPQ